MQEFWKECFDKLTLDEHAKIGEIAKRAKYLNLEHDIQSDIVVCHIKNHKLDLDALLTADEYTFVHDVCGITKNLNRNTGEVENLFVPRTAI